MKTIVIWDKIEEGGEKDIQFTVVDWDISHLGDINEYKFRVVSDDLYDTIFDEDGNIKQDMFNLFYELMEITK